MTSEEIKNAMKEALQEERSEFWISQPEHYDDHKWVQSTRGSLQYARKVGAFTTISTVVGVILLLLWAGFKEWVQR